MREELGRIGERGCSTDREENEAAICCVGAPVFDHDSEVVAAIGAAGPALRIDEDRSAALASLAIEAAREISVRLGMHRPGRRRPDGSAGDAGTVHAGEGRGGT